MNMILKNMQNVLEIVWIGTVWTMTNNEKKAAAMSRHLLSWMSYPADLTVSEWAAQNRRLSSEASAETGAWRNERTPYLVEVMDAFTDPSGCRSMGIVTSDAGSSRRATHEV